MSTNYRTYQINVLTSSVSLGKNSVYPKAWAIMKGEGNVSGSLSLEGGGSLNLASLDNHQIFPCYPQSITISAGALYLLS
jgi:hypothetical protein